MRYHLTPARKAIIKKTRDNKYWWRREPLCIVGSNEGGRSHLHYGRQYGRSLKRKKESYIIQQFRIWVYIWRKWNHYPEEIFYPMFTAAIFTIAKIWKQPQCSLTDVWINKYSISSVQFSSVPQSCPTLGDPMNRSTPGFPVYHHFPEFTQTHVHRVGDAIQPSHPLSSPSPPAPNPHQHQSLLQWVNSSHEVAKVLEFQL